MYRKLDEADVAGEPDLLAKNEGSRQLKMASKSRLC
jgi:hypothetical protein